MTLGKQTATTNTLFTFPKFLPFLDISITLINFVELHFQKLRLQAPEDEIQQPNTTRVRLQKAGVFERYEQYLESWVILIPLGTTNLAINRLRAIKMAIGCTRKDDTVKKKQLVAQKAHAHMVSRLK